MTIATLILLSLLVLVLLYGIFQINSSLIKLVGKLDETQKLQEKEIHDLKNNLATIESNFDELSQLDRWDTLNKNLIQLERLFEQLKLDDYTLWEDAVERESDEEAKLELLESAAERFPSQVKLFKLIREILDPLANDSDNLLIRREALIRLRKHANNFSENCSIENFNYARNFKNEVIVSIESVVKKIDELRETNLSKLLNELEEKIKKIKKNSDKNGLLEEVEKIDSLIDQNVIVNFPELKNRYEKISKNLIQVLGDEESDVKSNLKELNEKALLDAKKIVKLIENHSDGNFKDKWLGPDQPVNYNEKLHLSNLTKLLSNKDKNKLLPSTANYLRMIEAEVFNKLSSDGKILFTELMIEEEYK